MESLLNKKNTTILHGLAILMMVYHHLFISGNTWFINSGTSLFDIFNGINFGGAETAQQTFAWFCKICVAIFAFTSGYAMFVQFERKCNGSLNIIEMYKYCIKRLLSFYIKYFLCFVFFVGYEYLTGNQDGFDYSLSNVILSLLGLRTSFNGTWWYIAVYYRMVLLSPIIYVLLNKMKLKDYLIIIGLGIASFIIAFISGHFIEYFKSISVFIQNFVIIYIVIFAEGMFCGRYKFLDYIASKLNFITSLLLLIITYILRVLLIRAPSDSLFDIVLTIPFVLSITKLISYSNIISNFLHYMGNYSTYTWFIHAYFYSYLFFNTVYRADMSLLVYVQVVLYSLVSSILFDYIEKNIKKLISLPFENNKHRM